MGTLDNYSTQEALNALVELYQQIANSDKKWMALSDVYYTNQSVALSLDILNKKQIKILYNFTSDSEVTAKININNDVGANYITAGTGIYGGTVTANNYVNTTGSFLPLGGAGRKEHHGESTLFIDGKFLTMTHLTNSRNRTAAATEDYLMHSSGYWTNTASTRTLLNITTSSVNITGRITVLYC